MDDLVERLRDSFAALECGPEKGHASVCWDAADEIERLRARVADLEQSIVNEAEYGGDLPALANAVRNRALNPGDES